MLVLITRAPGRGAGQRPTEKRRQLHNFTITAVSISRNASFALCARFFLFRRWLRAPPHGDRSFGPGFLRGGRWFLSTHADSTCFSKNVQWRERPGWRNFDLGGASYQWRLTLFRQTKDPRCGLPPDAHSAVLIPRLAGQEHPRMSDIARL